MAVRSRGRGAAAALGLFCLFVGLVGGAVLYIVAERRPAQTVDGFARAPVGCNTTLEFVEAGTFYVFEEVGAMADEVGNGCQPVADPNSPFRVDFTGELTPASTDDVTDVSYDVDGFDGRSVQSVEIVEPGQYTIEVLGDDLTVVAAIGRDPDAGVGDLRRAAVILAVAGIVLETSRDREPAIRSRVGAGAGGHADDDRRWAPHGSGAGEPTRAAGPGRAGGVGAAHGRPRRRPGAVKHVGHVGSVGAAATTRVAGHPRPRVGYLTGGGQTPAGQRRRITVTTRPKMLTSSAGNRMGSIVELAGTSTMSAPSGR